MFRGGLASSRRWPALLLWLIMRPGFAAAAPFMPIPAAAPPPAAGAAPETDGPSPGGTSGRPAAGSGPAAPPVPAGAPDPIAPADGEVERHVTLGHRLFALARYEEAVAEFRRAYELRAEPRFLFHIAECFRELGSKDQALFYYDRYLIGAPNAPDREEVEQKIADLGGVPGRAIRPRPRLLMEPVEEAPPKPQPGPWRRWWFWTALGVAVAAGVTAGALAGGSDEAPPVTALGSMRFF